MCELVSTARSISIAPERCFRRRPITKARRADCRCIARCTLGRIRLRMATSSRHWARTVCSHLRATPTVLSSSTKRRAPSFCTDGGEGCWCWCCCRVCCRARDAVSAVLQRRGAVRAGCEQLGHARRRRSRALQLPRDEGNEPALDPQRWPARCRARRQVLDEREQRRREQHRGEALPRRGRRVATVGVQRQRGHRRERRDAHCAGAGRQVPRRHRRAQVRRCNQPAALRSRRSAPNVDRHRGGTRARARASAA